MVAALVFTGALNNLDIFRFFHHADGSAVALRVHANAADGFAGDIAADSAEGHAVAHRGQRVGQAVNIFWVHVQHVERNSLRALRTHTGKSRQLINEVLQRSFKHA
jgi:hypothetical protein